MNKNTKIYFVIFTLLTFNTSSVAEENVSTYAYFGVSAASLNSLKDSNRKGSFEIQSGYFNPDLQFFNNQYRLLFHFMPQFNVKYVNNKSLGLNASLFRLLFGYLGYSLIYNNAEFNHGIYYEMTHQIDLIMALFVLLLPDDWIKDSDDRYRFTFWPFARINYYPQHTNLSNVEIGFNFRYNLFIEQNN